MTCMRWAMFRRHGSQPKTPLARRRIPRSGSNHPDTVASDEPVSHRNSSRSAATNVSIHGVP
jgi:hypothetical protein